MQTDGRPADTFSAITPSDSADIAKVNSQYPRGIYVGVDGDVVAVRTDDTAVTFKNAVAGTVLPVRAKRVNSTGTTATNLVALY